MLFRATTTSKQVARRIKRCVVIRHRVHFTYKIRHDIRHIRTFEVMPLTMLTFAKDCLRGSADYCHTLVERALNDECAARLHNDFRAKKIRFNSTRDASSTLTSRAYACSAVQRCTYTGCSRHYYFQEARSALRAFQLYIYIYIRKNIDSYIKYKIPSRNIYL